MLKKREFKFSEFQPKDIRIISNLPTYIKQEEENIKI